MKAESTMSAILNRDKIGEVDGEPNPESDTGPPAEETAEEQEAREEARKAASPEAVMGQM